MGREGITGWTVLSRKSNKCGEDCTCKRHTTKNSGQFKKGQPPVNPNAIDNLRAANERKKLWTNGTGYEGQFTYTLRMQVWQRDESRCRGCNKQLGVGLGGVVHHIDFNKGNSVLENLVLLCRSCHAKRHYEGARFTGTKAA